MLDCMAITLFRSAKRPDIFAFTADETGSNLPAGLAPWTLAHQGSALATGPVTAIGVSDPVVAAVERDGFYIARSETFSHSIGTR